MLRRALRGGKQYCSEAHEALYPLWESCQKQLAEYGVTEGARTYVETLGGALIEQSGCQLIVNGAYEVTSRSTQPLTEELTIVFPKHPTDLSKSSVTWVRYMGDEFESVGSGQVAPLNYPEYALSMYILVTGGVEMQVQPIPREEPIAADIRVAVAQLDTPQPRLV